MRIKFSLFVLCSVILLSFVACSTNKNGENRSPEWLARNYLSINANENFILYEEIESVLRGLPLNGKIA